MCGRQANARALLFSGSALFHLAMISEKLTRPKGQFEIDVDQRPSSISGFWAVLLKFALPTELRGLNGQALGKFIRQSPSLQKRIIALTLYNV